VNRVTSHIATPWIQVLNQVSTKLSIVVQRRVELTRSTGAEVPLAAMMTGVSSADLSHVNRPSRATLPAGKYLPPSSIVSFNQSYERLFQQCLSRLGWTMEKQMQQPLLEEQPRPFPNQFSKKIGRSRTSLLDVLALYPIFDTLCSYLDI
jgi:hypothetical protein